jgi:hypothetical protein
MAAYYEPNPSTPLDPTRIVADCIESGAACLLLDEPSLPPQFFDLSSGLAGELLHRLSLYRMRLAAVVPEQSDHSTHFRAFIREANRGEQYRFFPTRDEAIEWLEST